MDKTKIDSKKFGKYVIPLVVIISCILIVVVISIYNSKPKKTIITEKFVEYWVADIDIKYNDIDNDRYQYEEETSLYAFYEDRTCEILTMNSELSGSSSSKDGPIIEDATFFDENLKPSFPKGAWISRRSDSCTYSVSNGNIVMNVDDSGSHYSLIGTYRFADYSTLLISWENYAGAELSYTKVRLKEYVEDFYLYVGTIGPKITTKYDTVKINMSELNIYKDASNKDFFELQELVSSLEKKYNRKIDLDEFILINDFEDYSKVYSNYYYPAWHYPNSDQFVDDNVRKIRIPIGILDESAVKRKIKENLPFTGIDLWLTDFDIRLVGFNEQYDGLYKYYEYYLKLHFDNIDQFKQMRFGKIVNLLK